MNYVLLRTTDPLSHDRRSEGEPAMADSGKVIIETPEETAAV